MQKMGTVEVGHKLTPEEILERVNRYWDMSLKFPMPRKKMLCPICKSDEVSIRQWYFFQKPAKIAAFRCDIAMKCGLCGHSWMHGLTITEEQYERGGKRRWTWEAVHRHWRLPDEPTGYWCFNEAPPFPVPTQVVLCPDCSINEALTHVIMKSWEFMFEPLSKPPVYFVDIAFKCGHCSGVWAHRIDCTRKQFMAGSDNGKPRRWTWRQAHELLKRNQNNNAPQSD
ncbi:MAG: hypothetical protein ACXABY_17250 [Candidatus Thorarchaeota archaeon]|jgi:hypothetical protein